MLKEMKEVQVTMGKEEIGHWIKKSPFSIKIENGLSKKSPAAAYAPIRRITDQLILVFTKARADTVNSSFTLLFHNVM